MAKHFQSIVAGFIFCLLLVCIGFLLYRASLSGQFIWDDQFLVQSNYLIRSPRYFLEAWRQNLGYDPSTSFYRPVQTLSYMIDYWRGGLDPWPYRQTNILLHGLNGSLLFLLLANLIHGNRTIFDKSSCWPAFLFTLAWLVHPAFSATVAYIAGRADSLALFFLLLLANGWLLAKNQLPITRAALGLLLFAAAFLAMGSKEAALTGVALFLIAALFDKKEPPFSRVQLLTGGFLLYAIYLTLRFTITSTTEPATFHTPWAERPGLILRALGDYLRIVLVPIDLRMERQITQMPDLYSDLSAIDPLFRWLGWLGAGFILVLTFSFWKRGTFQFFRRAGVVWFAILLLPVSNLFSLNATVAEHWLYIPGIGLVLIALGFYLEAGRTGKIIFSGLTVVWIGFLAARTVDRVNDWQNPVVFYETTIRSGGDTARMRVQLANEYQKLGRNDDALQLLRDTVKRSPEYAPAKQLLAVLLQRKGLSQEADALLGDSSAPLGNSFLGKVFTARRMLQKGDIPQGADRIRELSQHHPESWRVTQLTLLLLEKTNRPDLTIPVLERFVERCPWHEPAVKMLAELQSKKRSSKNG